MHTLSQRRRSHSHSAGAVVRERNRLERELAEGEAESEAREEGPHLALSGLVCRRPSYTGRPPRVPLVLSLRLGGNARARSLPFSRVHGEFSGLDLLPTSPPPSTVYQQ